MPHDEKEVENMPIWQDHERRITTLETTFASMSHEMKDVKSAVEKTGNENKELLNTLIEHHLETKKMKISNFWQVVLNITGAGSIVTVIIYAIVQIVQILGGIS